MPPMPFVPAPSTMLVRLIGKLYSDTCINDIWIKKTAGGLTITDLANVAALMADWAITEFVPELSEHYSLENVQVRDMQVPNGQYVDYLTPSTPGGIAGTGAPGNATVRLFFRGAQPQRGGRHGVCVSGAPLAALSGNNWVGTFAGNVFNAFQTLAPNYINPAGLYYWANVSKILNKAPRTEAYVDPVVQVTYSTKVHTMGKRVNNK